MQPSGCTFANPKGRYEVRVVRDEDFVTMWVELVVLGAGHGLTGE